MRVRVFFFGAARDAAGHGQVEIELPSSCHAANAFEKVLMAYPALRRFGRSLLFAVNQEYALGDREIHNGDELAVFPPVSGGGGANHDRTRTQPAHHGAREQRRVGDQQVGQGTEQARHGQEEFGVRQRENDQHAEIPAIRQQPEQQRQYAQSPCETDAPPLGRREPP